MASRRHPKVIDRDGRAGTLQGLNVDDVHHPLAVVLVNGVRLAVPFELFEHEADGGYRVAARWKEFVAGARVRGSVPVVEERVRVSVTKKPIAQVRVRRRVVEEKQLVETPLVRERIEIERVPVGVFVDRAPEARREGDTWIVPCVEEVTVVEKRLRVREEVRLRVMRESHTHRETVVLRRHEVDIENAGEPIPSEPAKEGDKP